MLMRKVTLTLKTQKQTFGVSVCVHMCAYACMRETAPAFFFSFHDVGISYLERDMTKIRKAVSLKKKLKENTKSCSIAREE